MAIVGTDNLAVVTLTPSGFAPYLTDSEYTLNGGSIELDIVGSPGLLREETKTITLDGANAYKLSWERSHTEFEVNVRLFPSTDGEETPVMDSILFKDKSINGDASPTDSQSTSLPSSETANSQPESSPTNASGSILETTTTTKSGLETTITDSVASPLESATDTKTTPDTTATTFNSTTLTANESVV